MICQRCLHRANALRSSRSIFLLRSLTTTAAPTSPIPESSPPPTASTPNPKQPFSTPLQPNLKNPGNVPHKVKRHNLPVSTAPAGTQLKGLNYLKGREDPIAREEAEYPEWLWTCLEAKSTKEKEGNSEIGDEFSKSKKQRQAAAKAQRQREAKLLASGDLDALAPKIPLQQQTIDLPFNEGGTAQGALQAVVKRQELTKAMREERRAKIKEANYLKGV